LFFSTWVWSVVFFSSLLVMAERCDAVNCISPLYPPCGVMRFFSSGAMRCDAVDGFGVYVKGAEVSNGLNLNLVAFPLPPPGSSTVSQPSSTSSLR